MKQVTGLLSKMVGELNAPIIYSLPVGSHQVPLNPLIGQNIALRFQGRIVCQGCGRIIKKSYQDGFCFPCTQTLARCDFCVVKPERCHFHLGTCREPEWGLTHCMIPHMVYLANSTGLKVGITRHHQIPTRWIDQGAIQAMPLFHVPTRQVSGFVEVAIARFISDATQWRALIKGSTDPIDMLAAAEGVCQQLGRDLDPLKSRFGEAAIQRVESPAITTLDYPIAAYPEKCATLSFDKTPEIRGQLLGIKGQYLFFAEGALNIRKHQGYEVTIGLLA